MTSTAELVTQSAMDLNKKSEKNFKTMSMKERFIYVKELITVEPVIACYLIPSILCGPGLIYLEYEKSCTSSARFNRTICDSVLSGENDKFTEENFEVQKYITNMHSWTQPIQSIVPLITILFLGSYSDRHQIRKPFLIIPLIGELLSVLGCMLSAIYMEKISLNLTGIFQTVIPSFFGGQTMITVMIFAYIADVSTIEMRTLRVGLVQIFLNVCSIVVQSFSGPLFAAIGYTGTFSIAICVYLIGILYTIFVLKESKKPIPRDNDVGLLVDIFNPKNIYETFNLLIKKTPGNNRSFLILLMIVTFLTMGVTTGEFSVFYLFTQVVYSWTVVDYSYFLTFNALVHLKGTIIAIPLFTKVFHLTDYTIINVSFVDKILTNIIFAFGHTTVLAYIASYLSLINSISIIGIRALATKIVSENDLGKAQTLFGICEAIGSTVSSPVYNQSYASAVQTFPGAIFFIGVVIYILCGAIVFWMYIQDKRKIDEPDKNGKNIEKNGMQMEETQTTHI